MNVQIKVNGTDRSSYVISYEREHKICTGVGRLLISFSDNVPVTFVPWNYIDIYENGIFQVRYYVSSVDHNHPESTINLDCQDNSKRLVDYFIPDQYTVTEPTYTRYWIEKFLDEAGITHQFDNVGPGQLISNYTSLGLQPAYEQIMTLLQMSGWYMFFDGNGKCIIGSLNKNFSPVDATFDRTDILEIMLKKDDRMLRNRALVLGNYDPFTLQRAKADVTVKTKWNYDSRDVRTMVVSNSNIPNNSSAYGIANTLVKEFARITVEKHLTVHGARTLDLGDVVMVKSTVYFGKGLITTFGTRMSKEGLVTDIVLDERCPRLLGFYNFGDYVYVGTYGEGIWRKHIKYDHTWHDFSSGLVDMRATDLHINHGVFTAVTASGDMHYTLTDDGPWVHIPTPESLLSSLTENTTTSGNELVLVPVSGIMARATIVDKEINRILYGVDTWSGLNMGDYFMSISGWVNPTFSGDIVGSGVSISGYRGWLLEFHPISGMDTYNSYPISVSGNYNIMVLDVENDGFHDYVSVREGGKQTLIEGAANYNFGEQSTAAFFHTRDTSSVTGQPISSDNIDTNNNASIALTSMPVVDFNSQTRTNSIIAIDNPASGHRKIVSVGKTGTFTLRNVTRTFNVGTQKWDLGSTSVTKTGGPADPSKVIIGIHPEPSTDKYTVFYTDVAATSAATLTFYYREWDALANTLGSETVITTNALSITTSSQLSRVINIGGYIYYLRAALDEPATFGGSHIAPTKLHVDVIKINKSLRTATTIQLMRYETPTDGTEFSPGVPRYYWMDESGAGNFGFDTYIDMFQKDAHLQILMWLHLKGADIREYVFVGDETLMQSNLIYQDATTRFGSGTFDISGMQFVSSQLTTSKGFIGLVEIAPGSNNYPGFVFDGLNLKLINGRPYQFLPDNIYPIFNDPITTVLGEYIARNPTGSTFNKVSTNSYTVTAQIAVPTGIFSLTKPFSDCVNGLTTLYFVGRDAVSFDFVLIPYNIVSNVFDTTRILSPNSGPGNNLQRGKNFGGFFITQPSSFTIANPLALVNYIDLGDVEIGAGRWLVLQRQEAEFAIVQEGVMPIRIDISNFNPLLTVQSGVGSFESFYIYDSEVLQVSMPDTISGVMASGLQVEDYRYTLLPGSGELAVAKLGVYVAENDIYSFDTNTMSGLGILYGDIVGSGGLNRIETSNYAPSGQYIFVTTSGESPDFYQLDPGSLGFILHDGLPEARATIIRLDDVI